MVGIPFVGSHMSKCRDSIKMSPYCYKVQSYLSLWRSLVLLSCWSLVYLKVEVLV